jgi:prephenate dehydratase
MKVSIQGISGAFHEVAAQQYFNTINIEIIENRTFVELIESVTNNEADCAVIAVENTISGTINQNLNLVRESGLCICGETFLRIQQNLAALPGETFLSLKEIRSHYMAINQTRDFFRAYQHIALVESDDTAMSIKEVAENNLKGVGAIGSQCAIDLYGLKTLAKGIETNKKNFTRFWIIKSKVASESFENSSKASLSIVLPNKKGSLSQILSIISFYDIDLTKIESSPIIGEPWHYRFFIDIKYQCYSHFLSLLAAIKPLTHELNNLGCYSEAKNSFDQINNH